MKKIWAEPRAMARVARGVHPPLLEGYWRAVAGGRAPLPLAVRVQQPRMPAVGSHFRCGQVGAVALAVAGVRLRTQAE